MIEPGVAEAAASQLGARRRRDRRAAWNSVALIGSRFVSLLVNAALVPLTINHLGSEGFGVWVTLLSLVTLMTLSDLGVGNALVTRVARAEATQDRLDGGADIATAVALFCAVAAVLVAVGLVAAVWLPWEEVFNVGSGVAIADDLALAVAALVLIQAIRVPLDLVQNVRRGRQESYVNAVLELPSNVLRLGLVWLVVHVDGGFPWLVVAAASAPLLASALNWLLLIRSAPHYRPRIRQFDPRRARSLLGQGGLYFLLQVAVLVGYSSDNFVGIQILGPSAVTQYVLPAQLAFAGVAFISLVPAPLWAAYVEANSTGDVGWTRRALVRSLAKVVTAGFVGAAVLTTLGGPFIRWWSDGKVDPGVWLLAGFGSWLVLGSAGAAVAVFLNALRVVRLQVVCSASMVLLNLLLSVVLAKEVGVAGLIWGTTISYFLCVAVPYSIVVPRLVRNLE